jgi:hypothetical protein
MSDESYRENIFDHNSLRVGMAVADGVVHCVDDYGRLQISTDSEINLNISAILDNDVVTIIGEALEGTNK